MEVNFSKNPQTTVATQVVETPVEGVTVETQTGVNAPVAANPVTAVATRKPLPIGDTIPDFSDIILPRLNIVQKVGPLSEVYPGGAILYNGTDIIYTLPPMAVPGQPTPVAQPPLEIVVIGFKAKRFVERIEGGGKGNICATEADVVKAGGTLSYQEWELKKGEGMALYQPLAEALVLLFKPDSLEDNGGTWVYDVDGRKAVLALWGMKGSAYTKGAKTFYTARSMGCLREGYNSFSYNLSTKLEKFDTGNSAYVPIVIPKAKTSDAVKTFIAEVLAGL